MTILAWWYTEGTLSFSFGGNLCCTGPCSLSLVLVTAFGLFRCVGCLEGACPVVFELFPCDWLVVCTSRISCLSSYILCAGVRWAGYFCFEIGSWCLASIMFDLIWCSLVYQGRGPITFDYHFWFEIGSQLFGSSWFLGFCFMLFRWIGGREVVEAACSFGYELFEWGSVWVLKYGSFILRGVLWGWVVTMGRCGYCVYKVCFC